MALTNSFFEAINSGNVRRVRIMMKNSLLIDPTFNEFHEMEKAASSMDNLYDPHDGKAFIEDRSQWDDNYMNTVMVKVLSNFSHERIEHLKEVVHYLRPVARKVTENPVSDNHEHKYIYTQNISYQEQKRRDQKNGDYCGTKVAVGLGAVAGGIAGGVVTSVAGITVIGGVAAGAVIGGVVGGVAASTIINGGK